MGKKLLTKYGSCLEDKDGYWVVSSRKEGNKNKRLHRLIWEEHYGSIPKGYIIHHKDGDVKNNNINNLEMLSNFKHNSLHKKNNKNTLKKYAYIRRRGKEHKTGKERYTIRRCGKDIKNSYYIHLLYKWFAQTYPNEYLYLEIKKDR